MSPSFSLSLSLSLPHTHTYIHTHTHTHTHKVVELLREESSEDWSRENAFQPFKVRTQIKGTKIACSISILKTVPRFCSFYNRVVPSLCVIIADGGCTSGGGEFTRHGDQAEVVASREHLFLTESVHKVILQQSIPAQIRQLIFIISNNKGQVDGFVGELTFANRLHKHFL